MTDWFWLPVILLAGYGSWNVGRFFGRIINSHLQPNRDVEK